MLEMRKMKDSGIEWIGEIPEGWSIARGKHILTLLQRAVFPTDGVITCFRDGEVTLRSNRREDGFTVSLKEIGYQGIEPGDLVVHGMDRFAGSIGISDSRGKSSPVLVVLDSSQDKKYLMYYLRSMAYNNVFLALSTGIRVRSCDLKWNKLADLLYLVPPIVEQHKLVSFLDEKCSEIDAMLSKTRASIEEYKKLKQAIITQAVTKGVRGEREMKDSGVEWIGEIPKEWAVSPMKHFIDILPGYAFSSDDFCIEEGIPLLRGINVGVNEIRWDETVRWNHSISKQLESFFLKDNDLVVGLDRPWISDGTRVAFIAKKDLPCLLLQRVCRIRTRCNFDMRWIYYWLSGSSFKDSLSTETTGISVPHISTKQIEQFIVAFPNQLEQTQICNYLDAKCAEIDKLIAKKEQLVKELENYKKSLIYEVVTGKREV